MARPIVPAIIPQTAQAVREFCTRMGFSLELHLDVVDGQFVPFTSWPYGPAGYPDEVKSTTDTFTLEVDLMVAEPLPAARTWTAAGADMLVFHVETISLQDLEAFVTAHSDLTIGVSALNDTPYEVLEPYAAVADYVQVMGIAQIGAQGQPFDERALERIAQLKQDFPTRMVSVDGSVNAATLPRLALSKADRFIAGSVLFSATDPAAVHAELTALVM